MNPARYRVPTAIGLIAIVAAIVVTMRLVVFSDLNPDNRMLRESDEHIELIEATWKEFQSANPGTEAVTLRSTTIEMGAIAPSGPVPDLATKQRIEQFIEETSPPHGTFWRHLRVDPDQYARLKN